MNIKEIYVLNRALDGEDIVFIPSFRGIGLSEIMVDAVKDGMIERGLLKSYDEFTENGLRIADRIRRYKEAKKYTKLDNLLLGVIDEKESVAILWNPVLEEYAVTVVDNTLEIDRITESYQFLADDATESGDSTEALPYDALIKRYRLSTNNSLKLNSLYEDKIVEEIYFKADEKLFTYNCLTGALSSISRHAIFTNLAERMSIS